MTEHSLCRFYNVKIFNMRTIKYIDERRIKTQTTKTDVGLLILKNHTILFEPIIVFVWQFLVLYISELPSLTVTGLCPQRSASFRRQFIASPPNVTGKCIDEDESSE
jgi:hypothetical protein